MVSGAERFHFSPQAACSAARSALANCLFALDAYSFFRKLNTAGAYEGGLVLTVTRSNARLRYIRNVVSRSRNWLVHGVQPAAQKYTSITLSVALARSCFSAAASAIS